MECDSYRLWYAFFHQDDQICLHPPSLPFSGNSVLYLSYTAKLTAYSLETFIKQTTSYFIPSSMTGNIKIATDILIKSQWKAQKTL